MTPNESMTPNEKVDAIFSEIFAQANVTVESAEENDAQAHLTSQENARVIRSTNKIFGPTLLGNDIVPQENAKSRADFNLVASVKSKIKSYLGMLDTLNTPGAEMSQETINLVLPERSFKSIANYVSKLSGAKPVTAAQVRECIFSHHSR